ncbi:D-xylose-binding periplasmic protein precursor [Clostridium sp. N3C]|uniref:sugar ABC transporter substrate-binding protein n=1 Tax=Clostridium sp. N3C TaxID=1776758 RepID=UPI00092DEB9B|nr:substrate-binding domain-containing protein [Clostridium sp. N3C]SCN22684.1 D-xylose-binding periplasmic protein precursor [Clostridium sp. N3C]
MINKKAIKNFIIIVLFIILCGLVYLIFKNIGKSSTSSVDKDNIREKNKIKIGFSLGTLKEERWIRDRDILMAKAKEMGAELIVQNANNDDQDQLKQVKYLLDQKIDVLIFVPNDNIKSANAVEMAKEQGVPVISYDRLVLNAPIDLYISFDNFKIGELMANALLKSEKPKNLLIINGAENDNNTKMIKEGYDKVLEPFLSSGEINIVSEEWSANWLKETAFNIVDTKLQKGINIDGVIAGNDSLAQGVIEALSEHRLTNKVKVVGQDADLRACQRIVEGSQYATIYKPIEKLAESAIEMALKLGKKESINLDESIFNGKYTVPYYILTPIAVDKSNMEDTIIRDGFHLREEVYKE